MLISWLKAAWICTWLAFVPRIATSPIEFNRREASGIHPKTTNASLQAPSPAIDVDFGIDPEFGPDRLKATQVYSTVLEVARELALQDDYYGRVAEKSYHYAESEEVAIHIRGWPARACFRRYALWGLVQSISALSDNPPFRSAKVTLYLKSRIVGVMRYIGPETPRANLAASEIPSPSPSNFQRAYESPRPSESPLPYSNDPVSRQDGQPLGRTSSPFNVSTPFGDNRPGQLQVYTLSKQEQINIRDFYLAVIGGIIYVARNKMNDPIEAVNVHIDGFGAAVLIEAPNQPTDPPLRSADVVNALDAIVRKAYEDRKFEALIAQVAWLQGETLTVMGKLWIYKRDAAGLGLPDLPTISLDPKGSFNDIA